MCVHALIEIHCATNIKRTSSLTDNAIDNMIRASAFEYFPELINRHGRQIRSETCKPTLSCTSQNVGPDDQSLDLEHTPEYGEFNIALEERAENMAEK